MKIRKDKKIIILELSERQLTTIEFALRPMLAKEGPMSTHTEELHYPIKKFLLDNKMGLWLEVTKLMTAKRTKKKLVELKWMK